MHRTIVATTDDIIPHSQLDYPPSRRMNFTKSKKNQTCNNRNNQNTLFPTQCSLIFINEPAWFEKRPIADNIPLEIQENPIDGKLHCPKCKSKLGSYSWYGMPCTCGKWICPSFSIQKSKADVETMIGTLDQKKSNSNEPAPLKI